MKTRRGFRRNEQGYVLLTLMLAVSLMIIAAAAIVPSIAFEIKRDREAELIHRGVQYSRAIRAYYKKFGRYPAKLEDLESTNNMRFLRKRYKDPITGQDFKLLHYGEVKMAFSIPLVGAANVNGAQSLNGTASAGNTLFGQSQPGSAFGNSNSFGNSTGFGANTRTGPAADPSTSADPNQPADPNAPASSSTPQQGQLPGTTPDASSTGPTFGGMPVVGVVSTSKKDGIREFNHKKKYSEWQFIYDPATDRGGLLMTPNQQPLQNFGNQQLQPGQQGQQGTTGSPFGQSPGIQSNPNGPGTFGSTPNQPPPSNSPNQQ